MGLGEKRVTGAEVGVDLIYTQTAWNRGHMMDPWINERLVFIMINQSEMSINLDSLGEDTL